MEPLGTTLEHHIRSSERMHVGATGEFSLLLGTLATACKVISREVNRAGLLEGILGLTGKRNVQGEEVARLDEYANQTLVRLLGRSGHVAIMASEEVEDAILPPAGTASGPYAVLFDPLDGSSNIDVNASIGTIFSVRRRRAEQGEGTLADLLGPGREQAAAGYVIYGSSTILVYTAGNGVNAFTLDPSVGEFILSYADIRIPERGGIYSINEGNTARWSEAVRRLVEWYKEEDPASGRPYGARYIGSLVADFHRTLLKGGVFLYPADRKSPAGKLRLLYEAAPLALVAEQAGGAASDGASPILDISPRALHQRTPLVIGSRREVEQARGILGLDSRVGAGEDRGRDA